MFGRMTYLKSRCVCALCRVVGAGQGQCGAMGAQGQCRLYRAADSVVRENYIVLVYVLVFN